MYEELFMVSSGDAQDGSVSTGDSVPMGEAYDTIYQAVYDAVVASQEVTDGQNINNTALAYFEGILGNSALPQDYVAWVGDAYTYRQNNTTRTAYEYCLAYGDLEVDGTHFTGTGTICTMRVTGEQRVTYAHDQQIDLWAPQYYARSNLGDYSGIVQYDWTGLLLLIGMVIGGVTWFMKKFMRLDY